MSTSDYSYVRDDGSIDFGYPASDAQVCWAILQLIDSPVVGNLETYSTVGHALEYCKKDEVYQCLSSGERRLVNIAYALWRHDEDAPGASVATLTGFDPDTRRKVWVILGYRILGHDVLKHDHTKVVDMRRFKDQ